MHHIRFITAAAIGVALVSALAGCQLTGTTSETGKTSSGTAASNSADTVTVQFIRVVDGDTIAVKPTADLKAGSYGEHSVRLLGIDAPEMHKTTDQGPDCGAVAATEHLKTMLAGATSIQLVFDPISDHTDRYGRSLAYVELDGHDLDSEQVISGLAEAWYPYGDPAPTRYASYASAEKQAKASGAGSWGSCGSLGR